MLSPAIMFAPSAQRYMHEYGARLEHLAEVAWVCRANAQRNPRAVMHGLPLSLENYRESRMIAEPWRLYDCCQESDGACALIVTGLERARDLKSVPIRIPAAAQGGNAGWHAAAMGTHNMPVDEYTSGNGSSLARELDARAGVVAFSLDRLRPHREQRH